MSNCELTMPHLLLRVVLSVLHCGFLIPLTEAGAKTLEEKLKSEDPAVLARAARADGDAQRGAILFYQRHMACTQCHRVASVGTPLGPDLTKPNQPVAGEQLVQSILNPSQTIAEEYRAVRVITADGKVAVGLRPQRAGGKLTLQDAARPGQELVFKEDDVDEILPSELSIMPTGQVNQLTSRQQFLDLIRYLLEIGEGGPQRALQLEPPPSLYAVRPLPEYEKHIDHAGMIAELNAESFARGRAIYNRLCINCHGTRDKPGSLPTALRFATGEFKNGSHPHAMYQTLTRGFGMMVPQTWMVPRQKYDVIHYIREEYLKGRNPSQYFEVTEDYLAGLPAGDTRGPAPVDVRPWEQMDYGPSMIATYELGTDGDNFAYKGIAARLDAGPGGVSRGRHWMVFDHDTLRMAGAWSGRGFIDWNGINFNGRHGVHPRVVGRILAANPTGPGWANPETGEFEDPRLRGRDGKPYGPLPREWARYRGLYHHGQNSIVSYTIGETEVLEMPGLELAGDAPVFVRTFNIGPRSRDMVLQVARAGDGGWSVQPLELDQAGHGQSIVFGPAELARETPAPVAEEQLQFDGSSYVEVAGAARFNMHSRDYTIAARIKTSEGGTIFSKTAPAEEWVHDGKTLFVRGGRLCFDIGWVGVLTSRRQVNDGKWHDVVMTFDDESGNVRLFIDGRLDREGELRPKQPVKEHVARIGFTAPNFPRRQSYFEGEIAEVRFYSRQLGQEEVAAGSDGWPAAGLIGHWHLSAASGSRVADATKHKLDGRVVRGRRVSATASAPLVAGLEGDNFDAKWHAAGQNLRLTIPAGQQPLKFALWLAGFGGASKAEEPAAAIDASQRPLDLQPLTRGGPRRWPEELTTRPQFGEDDTPLTTDVLTRPVDNPWFAQLRFSGFDFLPGGDRLAVCTWDGDVWLVSGVDKLDGELRWQRIASGLFQPLGLKVVEGDIYVGCRDQIVILRDLNGDGETDFYENFNNDHQVTEHFHEFAMGLQTDEAGNFYYAKSARHALPALVPHHGTLLRVGRDGSRTEILATGFRAANGVCLNDDGTFIVTDQEGHWNPKNRINWVKPGGFYGNMFGYHDVTDTSDEAMEQPLCWITNSFDRSPAELLWVDSDQWGPLDGSLLNLSYGYGKIYVVPHEEVDGQMQGGMCELPIPQLPTGVMRGRFHPTNGQLYTCGLFAWAGNQHQPGGFYRVRYTGQPLYLPLGLKARPQVIEMTFSGELDRGAAADPDNFAVKVWSLKRTANYGSPHVDERSLKVSAARVSEDGKSIRLTIPELEPTWCMEIVYSMAAHDGRPVRGKIHNTVHAIPKTKR